MTTPITKRIKIRQVAARLGQYAPGRTVAIRMANGTVQLCRVVESGWVPSHILQCRFSIYVADIDSSFCLHSLDDAEAEEVNDESSND